MIACGRCGGELAPANRFCPSCGAPADPPEEPREAPAVEQPQPAAPAPPGRRRRGRVLLAATLALALAATGAVAFLGFRAFTGSSGGADTPEQAVTALLAALSREDYLAALELLPPDERDGIADALRNSAQAAARSGLKNGAALPDVAVTTRRLGTERLGEDAVGVSVAGEGVVDFRRLGGPLASLLPTEATRIFSSDGEGSGRLIAIRHDGRWYVDALLTLGDHLTRVLDVPSGDFGRVGVPDEAVRPESAGAAVEELLVSLAAKDVTGIERTLAAGEARFVRVFADAIDTLMRRTSGEFTIGQMRLTEVDGAVEFRGAHIEARLPERSVAVQVRSRCANWTVHEYAESPRAAPERCVLVRQALRDQLGLESLRIAVERTKGGYRVGVLETAAQLIARVAGGLDRAAILSAASSLNPAVAAYSTKAAAIVPGRPVKATFAAGEMFAAFDLDVAAGQVVSFRANHAGLGVFTRRPGGRWARHDDYQGLAMPTSDVGLRFVVTPERADECAETWYGPMALLSGCFLGETSAPEYELTVQEVAAKDASLPGRIAERLAPGEWRRLRVRFDEPTTFEVDNFGFMVRDSTRVTWEHPYVTFQAGEHELLFGNEGADPQSVVFTFLELREGFEGGGFATTVFIDGGEQRRIVHARSGRTVSISARPDTTSDIVLRVLDEYDNELCRADRGYGGDGEDCVIEPADVGRELVVIVDGYGDTDRYGGVQVELSLY